MRKIVIKRGIAYVIDVFIVVLFVTLLSFIPFVGNASKVYADYRNELSKLDSDLKTGLISNSEYEAKVIDIKYDADKGSVIYTLVSVGSLILYFVVFQYFNKGQTVGKMIMKVRVVGNSGNKLSIFNYFVRSLVVNNLFSMFSQLICLGIFSKSSYYVISTGISNIGSFLLYATFVCALWRNDERGIHDILGCSKVIDAGEGVVDIDCSDGKSDNFMENKVIDAVYEEN